MKSDQESIEFTQSAIPAPKRPLNSFFLYRKANQERISREFGISKSRDISRICAEMWKSERKSVKDQYKRLSFMQLKQESVPLLATTKVGPNATLKYSNKAVKIKAQIKSFLNPQPERTLPVQTARTSKILSLSLAKMQQQIRDGNKNKIETLSILPPPILFGSPNSNLSQNVTNISSLSNHLFPQLSNTNPQLSFDELQAISQPYQDIMQTIRIPSQDALQSTSFPLNHMRHIQPIPKSYDYNNIQSINQKSSIIPGHISQDVASLFKDNLNHM